MEPKKKMSPKEIRDGFLGLGLLVVIGWTVASCWPSGSASSDKTSPKECGYDLNCVIDEYDFRAFVACRPAVEDLAQYSYRWKDGWLDPAFDRFAWANYPKNEIVLIGDKIEFQNGFGAYQRVTYKCIYDFKNDTVVDAYVQPYYGHIGG